MEINKGNLTCYQSDDGFIALHPYGGTEPFMVQWTHGAAGDSIFDLAPGVYTYTVTDGSQCFTTGSVLVGEPAEIRLATDVVDATCGTGDGSATVVAYQGGVAPFNYLWSTGAVTSTAESLPSGSYSVTLTDSKGCTAATTATVSDINAPEIIIGALRHVSCFGMSDGAIDISVGTGIEPYHFEWSTSDTTEDISGLPAGSYTLTVSDVNDCKDVEMMTIMQPDKLGAFLSVENTQCGLALGVISANVVGGTQPFSFQWSSGGNKAIEFDLPSGNYQVSITDANGCQLKKEEYVADINGPVARLDSTGPAGCNNSDGYASVTVSGGTAPYTYAWSNGAITQDGFLDTLTAGIYEIIAIDAAGCQTMETVEVTVKKPVAPSVCVVTVDSVTGTNLVVWDKPAVPGIAKYRIYKERYIAGSFELTGEVHNDAPSRYNDEYASPRQRSWKYKITAVDECGNESEQSAYHETMHLTINASVNKDVNLIWNSYGGFSTNTYYIHRYARNTGWELIDSVPVSLFENKYTDFSPPPAHLTYYISYDIPGGGCNTTGLKNSNGLITRTISNFQESDLATAISDVKSEDRQLVIYPNPFREMVYMDINLVQRSEVLLKVTNTLGKVVVIDEAGTFNPGVHTLELDIPGPAGLYFIEIITGDKVVSGKVIKGTGNE